jgi:hypothetical protein
MKQLLKMKQLIKILGVYSLVSLLFSSASAQEDSTAAVQEEKPELMVNLHYYSVNNSYQYLKTDVKLKADNKLQPVKDVVLQVYLDSATAENLIGKTTTNAKGEAKSPIPWSLKDKWVSADRHKFIVITEATQKSDETTTELEIAKARIVIDTLNEDGLRSVQAKVESLENGEWVVAKDVEVKLGAKRMGGILKINDEEAATTDSTGFAVGEFKLTELPAEDSKNNITLVARTEDNELYGNLSIEKTVPWGTVFTHQSNVGNRSLWATRHRSPIWLLVMAYSIIAGVWSVILYLIFQIVKISRLGKKEDSDLSLSNPKISKKVLEQPQPFS